MPTERFRQLKRQRERRRIARLESAVRELRGDLADMQTELDPKVGEGNVDQQVWSIDVGEGYVDQQVWSIEQRLDDIDD